MDITPLQGVILLAIGLGAALLGITGRLKYSGRMSLAVLLLIGIGLYAIFAAFFR